MSAARTTHLVLVLLASVTMGVSLGAFTREMVQASAPEYAAPAEIGAFFDTFDRDRTGKLDFREARLFFDWVEDNVVYRYDDEHVAAPADGARVGDGRAGTDFHQRPEETLAERAGDCEDMNALELAFYRHFGVTAYEALVNSRPGGEVDHAIAIVYGGATRDSLAALSRDLDYYELGAEQGVPAGFYFVVDNAYSDRLGSISGGIEEGAFRVSEVRTLAEMLTGAR